MNPLVPGLSTISLATKTHIDANNKMSACDQKSKINITDTVNQIKKKINSTYCLEGDAHDNTLMILLDKVIFPILHRLKSPFVIQKPEKFGGQQIIYEKYEEVFNDFDTGALHPGDFKLGILGALASFLEPIRTKFEIPELKTLLQKAYPV